MRATFRETYKGNSRWVRYEQGERRKDREHGKYRATNMSLVDGSWGECSISSISFSTLCRLVFLLRLSRIADRCKDGHGNIAPGQNGPKAARKTPIDEVVDDALQEIRERGIRRNTYRDDNNQQGYGIGRAHTDPLPAWGPGRGNDHGGRRTNSAPVHHSGSRTGSRYHGTFPRLEDADEIRFGKKGRRGFWGAFGIGGLD